MRTRGIIVNCVGVNMYNTTANAIDVSTTKQVVKGWHNYHVVDMHVPVFRVFMAVIQDGRRLPFNLTSGVAIARAFS